MGRRGRPRKAGKRNDKGKLVRDNYPVPIYDHGTERAQARFKRFGTHGATALGRAYASGLLGEEQEASLRYDAGKRFARLYSALIEQGRYRCPLARERLSSGVVVAFTGNRHDEADQAWLFDAMEKLDRAGLRPWLDQLVLDLYADQGPYWLDALLAGGNNPSDQVVLKAALDALDLIAPKQGQMGIRVVVA